MDCPEIIGVFSKSSIIIVRGTMSHSHGAPLLCYVREIGFGLSGNTWAFSEIQHNNSKRGMCLQVVHPSFHFQERRL